MNESDTCWFHVETFCLSRSTHSDIGHTVWIENSMIKTVCVYYIAMARTRSHSLELGKTESGKDTWQYLLRTEGDALMCEAVG